MLIRDGGAYFELGGLTSERRRRNMSGVWGNPSPEYSEILKLGNATFIT